MDDMKNHSDCQQHRCFFQHERRDRQSDPKGVFYFPVVDMERLIGDMMLISNQGGLIRLFLIF